MRLSQSIRALAVSVAILPMGCFEPPSGDVYFSCEPADRDACPPDYACQADGCCHRNGSDVDASWNACRLSANTSTSTSASTTSTTTTGSESTSTSTDPTDTGESTAAETTGGASSGG